MALLSLSLLERLPTALRFADLLDIGVIAVFLYYAWTWLRNRASRAGLAAVGSAVLLYALARASNMYLTLLLFQAGFTILLLALVLVFQEDLRRIFTRIATLGFHTRNHTGEDGAVDVLTEVASKLAEERIGALVVLKGREPVEPYVDGGTTLDGRMSVVILYSIFDPASPGHDGAVLVEGNRIERLGVRLPLSRNLAEIGEAGTRHAAALGLSERTDAEVLVVSEEHGTIRIAQRGRLVTMHSQAQLRGRLIEYYRRRQPSPGRRPWYHFFLRRTGTKLASLTAAVLLWLILVYQLQTVQRTYLVPIEYRNVPENLLIEDPTPAQVRVSLSGPEGIFSLFHPETAVVSLDMTGIREGRQEIAITEDNLKRPPALFVDQMQPRSVWFNAHQLVTAELPVKIQFEGHLHGKLALMELTAEPATVPVLVPRSQATVIRQIRTEPVDLEDVTATVSRTVNLVLPPSARFVGSRPPKVRVTIGVAGSPAKP